MKCKRHNSNSAFTIVETILIVGLVSLLGAIALHMGGSFKEDIETAKLEQDVQTINAAARVFLANGGNFEGVATPQEALDRMKTTHVLSEKNQFVGVPGATIDNRLAAVPARKNHDGQVAFWDSTSQLFVVGDGDGLGVSEFRLDDTLSEIDYGEVKRETTALEYNSTPGWIWGYVEESAPVGAGPTVIPTNSVPESTLPVSSVPVGSSTPVAIPPSAPPSRAAPPRTMILLAPPIYLSSRVFNDSTPEITVRIDNPNPVGASAIFYSLVPVNDDHGPRSSWLPYEREVVTQRADFPDGFRIVAYAKSINPEYLDSDPRTEATTSEFFGIPALGNVLFVLDASESMRRPFGSTTRFEATRKELISAIEGLPVSIKFNVALFDGGVHWTDGTFELHSATPEAKERFITQVSGLTSGRNTNYSAALSLPTRFEPIPDQVILLSDGEPNDNEFLNDLADLVSQGVRVDTVGLDSNVIGRAVLQKIADETGGNMRFVSESSHTVTVSRREILEEALRRGGSREED